MSVSQQTPSRALGNSTKRRGLLIVLVNVFLMWGGFFMVIPLISVHYVHELGWDATLIGLVLALRQFLQQGLTIVGGMIADRIGAKVLICAGMIIRAISFGAMAWADTPALLLLAGVLAGLGGALFESPTLATVAALTDETNRSRVYALYGTMGSLGITVGPLVGTQLLKLDFALVAFGASSCFLLAFAVTLLFFPMIRISSSNHQITYGIGLALRDRPFLTFSALLAGYWFISVQLSTALPLVAEDIAGTSDAVGWLYLLNASMGIALQYPLQSLVRRKLPPLLILIVGVSLMALGLGSVALAQSVTALLLCVATFTLGAMLAAPGQQTVTANLANPSALGSYYGVNALSLAVGGGLGNFSGGMFYALGQRLHFPALPWLVFCTVGIITVIGLGAFNRRRTAAVAPQSGGVT